MRKRKYYGVIAGAALILALAVGAVLFAANVSNRFDPGTNAFHLDGTWYVDSTAVTATGAEINWVAGIAATAFSLLDAGTVHDSIDEIKAINGTSMTALDGNTLHNAVSTLKALDDTTLTAADGNTVHTQIAGVAALPSATRIGHYIEVLENDPAAYTDDGTTVASGSSVIVSAGLFTLGKSIDFDCIGFLTGGTATKTLALAVQNGATITDLLSITTGAGAIGNYTMSGHIFEHTDSAHQKSSMVVTLIDGTTVLHYDDYANATTHNFATVKNLVTRMDMSTHSGGDGIQQDACSFIFKP